MATIPHPTTRPPRIAFRPRRLGHVNLFVSSVDRSLPFYMDVCGFDQVFAEPPILAVFLGNGSTHHDIALMGATDRARVGRDGHVQVAADRGTRAGLNHLGFEMETERDLVDAIHRAREASFDFHRIVDHQISHSVYMFDPDGNYIEVYADVTPEWRRVYAESEGQLVTGSWNPEEGPISSRPMYEPTPEIRILPGALVHPRRVSGAELVVSDLARSIRFYEDVLGLTMLEHDSCPTRAVLTGSIGQTDLTLVAQLGAQRLGLNLVRVELASEQELLGALERLAGAGIAPPAENLIRSESNAVIGFVLRDPDGVGLEFTVSDGRN